jgi:HAD superfamily hydrolase (TIGR01509 family)
VRFRAVIFDMGDIFFDATPWRRALTARLQELGVAIDYPQLCRGWEAKLVEVYLGRREYWAALTEFVTERGLSEAAVADTIAFAREMAARVEARTLFDGVAETLAALRAKGVSLAVLSDTESPEARVRCRLAQMGIERCFAAVVTSIDIGHVKPEPEAYAAALARLGATADQTAFVGHDVDELEGAMQCGMTAIAYNYESDAPASHFIDRFPELLNIVDGSPARQTAPGWQPSSS